MIKIPGLIVISFVGCEVVLVSKEAGKIKIAKFDWRDAISLIYACETDELYTNRRSKYIKTCRKKLFKNMKIEVNI